MNIKSIALMSLSGLLIGASVYLGAVEYRQTRDDNESSSEISYIQNIAQADKVELIDSGSSSYEEVSSLNLDWNAIKSENENIKGWIHIDGTKINLPIMKGNDNQFYLDHSIDGNYNPYGSLFIDYRQNDDLSSMNTFIYGHNINPAVESSFFGELRYYYDQDFFDDHKKVTYYTEDKVYEGEVFAIHADSAKSSSYQIEYDDREDLQEYAQFMLDNSEVSNEFDIDEVDNMITLWTCANMELTDTNGNYTSSDKSRTFVSISLKEI